MEREQIE